MSLTRNTKTFVLTVLALLILLPTSAMAASTSNSYSNSDFIETEQPELSEETKTRISMYQKNPTEENYLNLRDIVIENYNAVLDRKEAKLAELKTETAGKPGGDEIVAEMEDIVQDMYITYWNRINSSMLRFTDTRLLKWKISNASQYEYIPVMGAEESIYIKRTPVTNAEYADFVSANGAKEPSNWVNGTYAVGEENYPVNFVSYEDAQDYCAWLSAQDGVNTYRLPSESEWELAAGHMPKDAEFNCGVNDGRTPVEQYASVTRGAHGAIDFWGNVWEWTSTVRTTDNGSTMLGVKGGAWDTERCECRTEYRKEARNIATSYEDVGFRVIQVLNGKEPEQKVELATLSAPVISAVSTSSDSITLSWQPVDDAVEYQIFRYFDDTGYVKMLETVRSTSVTISDLEPGEEYSYIVQPISYIEIADNVSGEYAIKAICGQTDKTVSETTSMKLYSYEGMNYWLYTPPNAKSDMPLVVFLHGKFIGTDPDSFITSDGFPKWLNDGKLGNVPAYVLIPMLPIDQKDWISAKVKVINLIETVAEEKLIDRENISLTGFSMGGAGVWNIAATYPQLFSRVAPVSGGIKITDRTVKNLSTLSIWALVGSEDQMVNPQSTKDCASALSAYNADIKVTEFDGAEHTDVLSKAYLESGLINWLIGK